MRTLGPKFFNLYAVLKSALSVVSAWNLTHLPTNFLPPIPLPVYSSVPNYYEFMSKYVFMGLWRGNDLICLDSVRLLVSSDV